MKKLLLLVILLSAGNLMFSQSKGKMIPVTTDSKTGLSTYNQAMKYYDDVNLKEAVGSFSKALSQDPDFFMVNYQLAFYFLLNRAGDNFKKFSDAAINCKEKLSDGEELLRGALVKLKEGSTDVTDVGKKLMEIYPNDPNSYNNMVYFQTLSGDSTGVVETLNKAIKIAPGKASFYNQLGYAYLTLEQTDKAQECFDKYIRLDPKNPNVYDSKGDFYMYIKDYYNAYQSYMNAYSMDPSFSHDKAEIAKHMYEQTEGKKLEIITI
jgi:tetratricopeptide (TPR) repeat protein